MVSRAHRTWRAWLAATTLAVCGSAAAAVTVTLAGERAAAAQGASPDDAKREARKLADKGYEHFEAGEYDRAIPFFRDAEAKFHAPTLLLIQGHAHAKMGRIVAACALYRQVVDEKLPADAPQAFVDAQTDAGKKLDELTPKIATLKIVLKGMTPDRVKVSIDDVEIPESKVLEPIPQDPGTHKVTATIGGDDGGRAVFQTVTLKEGVTKQIQLVFRPGGPVASEVPPNGGGCASCEVARRDGQSGAPLALVASALTLALAAARRRRAPAPLR